jgi:peptidyl-prolyl cis-trans isomerase C
MTDRSIPIVMDAGALSEAARAAEVPGALPGEAPVLVSVADRAISEAEIAREMQHHRDDDPHAARAAAARALVVRELLRLEAERLGLDGEALAESGESAEEACTRVLVEREVTAAGIDEDSCVRWFEGNRERMRQPDRMKVHHILLACPPDDIAARARARTLGEELIAALKSEPQRFTELAMRHSACPSRDQGGDLGWLQPGETVPEFDRQLFMLRPGLAGLTVETRYGHHVVRVDSFEAGAPLDYSQAAPRIRTWLETRAQQNAVHDYLMSLCERYPVRGMEMPAP